MKFPLDKPVDGLKFHPGSVSCKLPLRLLILLSNEHLYLKKSESAICEIKRDISQQRSTLTSFYWIYFHFGYFTGQFGYAFSLLDETKSYTLGI